ncbi:MAG: hypothetical protein JXR49_21085 [Acidobacteria bacterium]|nr:hypothetical protein [Acidobacteriota bacterium]
MQAPRLETESIQHFYGFPAFFPPNPESSVLLRALETESAQILSKKRLMVLPLPLFENIAAGIPIPAEKI